MSKSHRRLPRCSRLCARSLRGRGRLAQVAAIGVHQPDRFREGAAKSDRLTVRRPGRCVSLVRQQAKATAVDLHRPDPRSGGPTPDLEGDPLPTRRPGGIEIAVACVCQTPGVAAIVSYEVELGAEPSVPGRGAVGDPLAARRPGRTPDVARSSDPPLVRPVRPHEKEQSEAFFPRKPRRGCPRFSSAPQHCLSSRPPERDWAHDFLGCRPERGRWTGKTSVPDGWWPP
jgi:hypothetical protein